MDVVSLLSSGTETLYALGVEPAAVSHECNYPPEVNDLPRITTSDIDPLDKSSREIDEEVQAADRNTDLYNIDRELLLEIEPDVILTQGVCDVCAVDTSLVDETLGETELDPVVVDMHPHTLGDILSDIEMVGEAVRRQERAEEVISELQARIEQLERRTSGLEHPDTCLIEWMDPIIVAGHWTPKLIEKAGGNPVMTGEGEASRPIEIDDLVNADPEACVVAPCGFNVNQTLSNYSDIAEKPGWREVSAVRNESVYVMDGENYFNRPGPRIVDSMEYLAMALHPEEFGEPPNHVSRKPIRIR